MFTYDDIMDREHDMIMEHCKATIATTRRAQSGLGLSKRAKFIKSYMAQGMSFDEALWAWDGTRFYNGGPA